ncbi:hypothetical protein ACX40Y_10610 [Sphingomonas sp. RS6]
MWAFAAMLMQPAAAMFAPPLDTPLLVVTERVDNGTTPLQFRLERRVRYGREEAGYRAEVTLIAATGEAAAGPAGAIYQAGFAALIGTPIVFHLDATGAVIAIDAQAAVWDKLCSGVGGNATDARSSAITTALRALPAETQRSLLASLIASLAAEDAGQPLGGTEIRFTARSPLGGGEIAMTGTRTLETTADGMVKSTTQASSAPSGAGATVEIKRERQFDPATGLIRFASETTHTRLGTETATRTTTIRVSRMASIARP